VVVVVIVAAPMKIWMAIDAYSLMMSVASLASKTYCGGYPFCRALVCGCTRC